MRRAPSSWQPHHLAAPYVLGLVLTVVVPGVLALGLAFTEYHGFTAPRFVGWRNLRDALGNPQVHRAALTTAVLVALVVPLRLLATVCAALLLARPSRGAGAARTAVFLPSVVPDTAWALLWLWLLNPQFGPVAAAAGEGLGLLTEEWPTRLGVAVMLALQLGEGFVIALAARRALPGSAYQAAAVEGAGMFYVLRHLTLPLMSPVIALLALRDAVLVGTATFVPILLLTEGGPRESTLTVPVHLYLQGFRYGDLGYVCMLSMLLLVLTSVLLLPAVYWYGRRRLV